MIKSWGNIAVDENPTMNARLSASPALPIGHCRSYGDVCISDNHAYIDNSKFASIIDFDQDNAIIKVESGITLRQILEYIAPYKMILLVSPGTSFATVGGCIANDVHGKNHETVGSFEQSVLDFTLRLPSGEVIECSREKSADIFWATIGGLGLTGVIENVTLQLKPVDNTVLTVTRARHYNLSSLMSAMDKFHQAPYCVAWLDVTQSGKNLGRGVLELAYHADEGIILIHEKTTKKLPFFAPSWLLNKYIVKLFNMFYFNRSKASRQSYETYEQFTYPLDHIQDWNKLYAKQGFYQFQCVIPFENAKPVITKILESIQQSSLMSPLAVLKRLGEQSQGLLSFPMAGYTLAIDIPAQEGAVELLRQLEALIIENKGRIYPAKDLLMDRQSFEIMYPNKAKFLEILKKINAKAFSKAAHRYGLRIE